ncbi:MAG TPA: LacI family DNA-binding transcriptional regulator [Gaiellaceae bacterium]|nr:LacI family DNA-binding transcriptional regulator [Gaiellaceae bacterium]
MPETRTRATIFDVAEAAGVSITTVSHVFSGKRRVNEATRGRVVAAAERLAYRPRAIARALAAGRTNTLALSVPFSGPDLLLNSFFAQLLPALSLAALERGFSFLFVPPDASTELTEPLLDGDAVDGAVLVVPARGDPFVRAVLEAGTPYVSIGRIDDPAGGRWVGTEARAIQLSVLEHLAGRGYERPALLSLSAKLSAIIEHESVFRELAGAQAPVVESGHVSERDGYDAALALLAGEDDRPDAVLCLGDTLALGTLRACEDLALDVPGDVGVVSVIDSPLATRVRPQLTAVDIHAHRHGEAAIELLAATLAGEDREAPVRIEADLVPRASTAR